LGTLQYQDHEVHNVEHEWNETYMRQKKNSVWGPTMDAKSDPTQLNMKNKFPQLLKNQELRRIRQLIGFVTAFQYEIHDIKFEPCQRSPHQAHFSFAFRIIVVT
jgi:hypothetical protein